MKLTASGLQRAEKCPASAHLAQIERVYADAEKGTAEHARLALETPAGTRAEVPYALNVVTGEARELPPQEHRAYPALGDEWLKGTADRVRLEPGLVIVQDHKTGWGHQVAPARDNLQLGFYALAASRVAGVDEARVEVLHEDGFVDPAPLDVIDLDALGSRLFAIVAAVRESERAKSPRVVVGDHCWRCPCFARCPAQTQLALTLSAGVDARELPTLELTAPAVAKGWARLKQIKSLLGEVERVYRAFAAGEPVDLGNGQVLGTVEKSRETIDGAVAFDTLCARFGGDDVAREACAMETSKAAIERAIKGRVKRGTAAAELRAALEDIGAANGIRRKTTSSVEEHARKETR